MTLPLASENRADHIAAVVVELRAFFAHHEGYAMLREQFEILLAERRAALAAGRPVEARGIAVIGDTGSGKTTAVRHLLRSYLPEAGEATAEVASFQVPSPATLKHVGHELLNALGYPMNRLPTTAIIWDKVRFHLRERQVKFLHLDEAQDLAISQSDREKIAVVNTLKSLMQNNSWPVGLILSGMPDLRSMLNMDPQLARRFHPVEFQPISAARSGRNIMQIVHAYGAKACLETASGLGEREFLERLVQASAHEFGRMIELIVNAIRERLYAGGATLEAGDFAAAFRRSTGVVDGVNPFIADQFQHLDARMLRGGVEL